eukprot:4746262-Prymnesium_polylepis.1
MTSSRAPASAGESSALMSENRGGLGGLRASRAAATAVVGPRFNVRTEIPGYPGNPFTPLRTKRSEGSISRVPAVRN